MGFTYAPGLVMSMPAPSAQRATSLLENSTTSLLGLKNMEIKCRSCGETELNRIPSERNSG